jgi:hypothetical protein
MEEIVNCPLCGKRPTKMVFGAGWAQDGYKCCGHTTDTLRLWNQYAAAMDLARAEVKLMDVSDKSSWYADVRDAAYHRVLEVLKGE